jgi:hypothetical protein
MERSFRSRLLSIDEVSHALLKLLVALGGYCTAQQTKSLLRMGLGIQARARMRTLERLGFLRRVTKYAVVYQATRQQLDWWKPFACDHRLRSKPESDHQPTAVATLLSSPALMDCTKGFLPPRGIHSKSPVVR